MEEPALSLRDYLLILRRRKWSLVLPLVLVLALAAGLALLWPPTWRSEATILIEDAEIPEELVSSLVNDYVEKRLELIDRRVMTTDSLLGIVQRYDLYPQERKRLPIAEVVDDHARRHRARDDPRQHRRPEDRPASQRQRRLQADPSTTAPRRPPSASPTSW